MTIRRWAMRRWLTRGVGLALGALLGVVPLEAAHAQLTVCGVADNSAEDQDKVAGRVRVSCSLMGHTAFFDGMVIGGTAPNLLSAGFSITGRFTGSGSFSSFVSMPYSLTGRGNMYPRTGAGRLVGPTGAVSTIDQYLQLESAATAFVSDASSPRITRTLPNNIGALLPQDLTQDLSGFTGGLFSGDGVLSTSLDFFAGADEDYAFDISDLIVDVSTDPNDRIVPEPATLLLTGVGLVALVAHARGNARGNARGAW